jgi:hypothetical protein
MCPKAELREQRGLTLYTLASRLQKQKAKLNPLVAACDLIGYFIFPVLCDLHVLIFKVLSLCFAIPSPISSEHSLFLFWPSSLLHREAENS